MTPDLEKELNDFKLSHYKNADFDSLTDKEELSKTFGGSHFKNQIFSLKRPVENGLLKK